MSEVSLQTQAYFSALREVAERFDHCITVAAIHLPGQPLVFINRQFERETGYTAEECLGRNCRFLQGSMTDQPARAAMAADIAARRSSFTDIVNFRKDGTAFVNRLLLLPLEYLSDEDHLYYIGIQRQFRGVDDPVPELKRLRHGEVQAAINNPLSIALGFAELGALDSARIDLAIRRIMTYVDALSDTSPPPQ